MLGPGEILQNYQSNSATSTGNIAQPQHYIARLACGSIALSWLVCSVAWLFSFLIVWSLIVVGLSRSTLVARLMRYRRSSMVT
jgi:hypothetical protein